MKKEFDEYLVAYLKNKGIDIYSRYYKDSENYSEERYVHIISSKGTFTTEEYIERHLLTDEQLAWIYDNIYEMGNPKTLTDIDCHYVKLAEEIVSDLYL